MKEVTHIRFGTGTILDANFTHNTFLVRFVIDGVDHDMWVSSSDCTSL